MSLPSLKSLFSKRNLLLYIFITLLPAIVFSYLLTEQQTKKIKQEYTHKAQWFATFHANQIDQFIGETIGRLEMLATFIQIQRKELNRFEHILLTTQEKDIRFSGFYWANPEGDLIIGSNELSSPVNIFDRDYFQAALQTGKTAISDAHIGRVTGRNIITIATPAIYNDDIEGLLIASLRLDHLQIVIEQSLKDENITVTDSKGMSLIHTRPNTARTNTITSSIDVDRLPWTVTAHLSPLESNLYSKTFLSYLAVSLIVSHIIFLFIQYFLLQRHIKQEKEQNEMQKMRLVENLAASTAHEIRNPLTGIKGLVQLLSEKHKGEKEQFYFTVILDEVNRINSIVSELLLLGKPTAQEITTYNANDIVEEILPIMESEANYKNVEILFHSTTNELPISCVKDHIKQVILNLVKNSLESMDNGGKLTILLENHNNICFIKVKDSGSGMSKDVIKQVFTPFYTSKTDGTGLGLPVCKRIIEGSGGNISIQSELNKGTEITIQLPLTIEK
ncbi:ATP-binding protein [Halalkalibacter kiskunsagensis]|uniref:histidine kinase n=1 Tax=Halalkalibacter kiskunsagensis TaxID=1548599 RepID=A0ABV6KE73_9BACI